MRDNTAVSLKFSHSEPSPSIDLALEDFHPTNTTTHKHAVDRWFNFIAGFSPEFVEACLNFNTSSNMTVLDPFSGCGTVQVQANKLGWRSIGYEPNPVFYRIASAKALAENMVDDIDKIHDAIQHGINNPVSINTLKDSPRVYLSKLFDIDIIESLLGAKKNILKGDLSKNNLAFLVLSKVLDLCSGSQTDGIYKAPTSTKKAHDPIIALDKVVDMLREDISTYKSNDVRLYQSSSQTMQSVSENTVSAIVTSPPYLNNFDFAEMTRMYLYFWGLADSWGDITNKVRSNLIVNTTTALKGQKDRQDEYRSNLPESILEEIDEVVSCLASERKVRAGKKEYDFLVYPYFSQMQDVLKECYRVLETGGRFHMIVADAALYGVHISTPQILAEILSCIGYSNIDCQFIRKRGHRWILDKRDGSKIGLGEYHIYGEKER